MSAPAVSGNYSLGATGSEDACRERGLEVPVSSESEGNSLQRCRVERLITRRTPVALRMEWWRLLRSLQAGWACPIDRREWTAKTRSVLRMKCCKSLDHRERSGVLVAQYGAGPLFHRDEARLMTWELL